MLGCNHGGEIGGINGSGCSSGFSLGYPCCRDIPDKSLLGFDCHLHTWGRACRITTKIHHGSCSSSCLLNLAVGPICTGQAVPGLVTLGQQAIGGSTTAAQKHAARAMEDKENVPVVMTTLVPVEEPATVLVPDPTPTLILGVLSMSLLLAL